MRQFNMETVLNDMHEYCQVIDRYKHVVSDMGKYEAHRIIRNEIIMRNDLHKGDFTYYYAMSRGR